MVEVIGGRTRARTWDPLIKSQLLYQLSYAPVFPSAGSPPSGVRLAKVGKSVQPRKVRGAAKKEAARCPVSFERRWPTCCCGRRPPSNQPPALPGPKSSSRGGHADSARRRNQRRQAERARPCDASAII